MCHSKICKVEVDEVEGWWEKAVALGSLPFDLRISIFQASRHGFRLAYRDSKGRRAGC